MGLYRNIAGFLDNRRVGLSLYDTPSLTLIDSGSSLLPSPFSDPVAYQQQQQDTTAAYTAEMTSRYDYLLTTPLTDLTTAGYYVENNGSIFQWSDAAHTTSGAYLGLDWIQSIENGRNTAGALLLHMQQPTLAIETAGYEGGGSTSFYKDNGVDPSSQIITEPIQAVQTLPQSTTTTTTTTTQTATTAAALTNNFLPLALVAGLGLVAVAGDQLLHQQRKIVFVGGVAALFYLMAKRT